MKNKKYMQSKSVNKPVVDIIQVSAFINNIKYIFVGNRVFTDNGIELK